MQLSIVSYLDQAATGQVRELQKSLSQVTGSRASLTSWLPHVTLGDGVEVSELEVGDLVESIKSVARGTSPFTIHLAGFSWLDSRPIGASEVSTPYVIYINVGVSQQLLNLVAKIDNLATPRSIWYHMPRPYLPHITLAFRDLTEKGYKDGLEHIADKNINLSSSIDHIALVQKLPDKDVEYVRIQLEG